MRISGYVMLVLMIGLIFTSVSLIVDDLSNHYDTDANFSEDGFIYGTETSSSMKGLQTSLETLGDEDQGWFSKLGAGITAIPYAVIASVGEIFKSQGYLSSMITKTGSQLNLSPNVIGILITMLVISVIFAIITFLHRQRA